MRLSLDSLQPLPAKVAILEGGLEQSSREVQAAKEAQALFESETAAKLRNVEHKVDSAKLDELLLLPSRTSFGCCLPG